MPRLHNGRWHRYRHLVGIVGMVGMLLQASGSDSLYNAMRIISYRGFRILVMPRHLERLLANIAKAMHMCGCGCGCGYGMTDGESCTR